MIGNRIAEVAGIWATTIGVLAAMGMVIGLLVGWPTHETLGCLAVALVGGLVAALAFRRDRKPTNV